MARKSNSDPTASIKEVFAEAHEKGYIGSVPDETPNSVYAFPNPGEGAPESEERKAEEAESDNE